MGRGSLADDPPEDCFGALLELGEGPIVLEDVDAVLLRAQVLPQGQENNDKKIMISTTLLWDPTQQNKNKKNKIKLSPHLGNKLRRRKKFK